MVDNKRVLDLIQKEEFLKKILRLKTSEEIQNAFREENAEISINGANIFVFLRDVFEKEGTKISDNEVEVLRKSLTTSLQKDLKPLSKEELTKISGGSIKRYISGESLGDYAAFAVSIMLTPITVPSMLLGQLAFYMEKKLKIG